MLLVSHCCFSRCLWQSLLGNPDDFGLLSIVELCLVHNSFGRYTSNKRIPSSPQLSENISARPQNSSSPVVRTIMIVDKVEDCDFLRLEFPLHKCVQS